MVHFNILNARKCLNKLNDSLTGDYKIKGEIGIILLLGIFPTNQETWHLCSPDQVEWVCVC